MLERTILHCDLNSFYASVELIDYPQYKNEPVAVAGNPESRHGIILAKNDVAKAFGVKTAETIREARIKCPQLILLPPNSNKYAHFSKRANAIYAEYTDQVEPFGIDESWLDVTGSKLLFGDGKTIADTLRKRMKDELSLTISVGVSFTKALAKLGSDIKKPDATTVITRENLSEIVYPLPVGDLLSVGGATLQKLNLLGIKTIGQLAVMDKNWLISKFGKHGESLYNYANGISSSEVARIGDYSPPKSIGQGLTFNRNLKDFVDLKVAIMALSERVVFRLRNHAMLAGGIAVTIKYPSLKSKDQQKSFGVAINTLNDIYNEALALADKLRDPEEDIRAITITAISLIPEDESFNLFDNTNEKQKLLDSSVHGLKKQFGKNIINRATTLNNDLGFKK